jgi:hypothetical protein
LKTATIIEEDPDVEVIFRLRNATQSIYEGSPVVAIRRVGNGTLVFVSFIPEGPQDYQFWEILLAASEILLTLTTEKKKSLNSVFSFFKKQFFNQLHITIVMELLEIRWFYMMIINMPVASSAVMAVSMLRLPIFNCHREAIQCWAR